MRVREGCAMHVRAMQMADTGAVRRLFRETIALGRPLPFPSVALDRYEALCLDWYLRPERLRDHAVLVDDTDQAQGYALVCGDQRAFDRWSRAAGLRWVAAAVWALALRRLGADEARFHRLRLHDGWTSWRRRVDPGLPAHAHLNLARGARGRMHVIALVDHIDTRCAALGLPGWYGEINAPIGRRAGALEAHGVRVVHRVQNRTLSWLANMPIERLTVARPLAQGRTR
jgi:hypothetical protein